MQKPYIEPDEALPLGIAGAALAFVGGLAVLAENDQRPTFPLEAEKALGLVELRGSIAEECKSTGRIEGQVSQRKKLLAGVEDSSTWICTAVRDGYVLTNGDTAFEFQGNTWQLKLHEGHFMYEASDGLLGSTWTLDPEKLVSAN